MNGWPRLLFHFHFVTLSSLAIEVKRRWNSSREKPTVNNTHCHTQTPKSHFLLRFSLAFGGSVCYVLLGLLVLFVLAFIRFLAKRWPNKENETRSPKDIKTTNLNIGFTHTLHFFFIYNQKESAVSKGDPMLRLVIFQCPSRLLPSRHKRLTPCGGYSLLKRHWKNTHNTPHVI